MLKIQDMPEFRTKGSKKLIIAKATDSIATVIGQMVEAKTCSVIIANNGKIEGIFTEHDAMHRVLHKGVKITDPVSKVMTKNPKKMHMSDSASDAIALMKQGKFRHIPIIDDKSKLVGVLSQRDLVALDLGDMIKRTHKHTVIEFFKSSQVYIMLLVIALYTLLMFAIFS